jgi:hypothetical protein
MQPTSTHVEEFSGENTVFSPCILNRFFRKNHAIEIPPRKPYKNEEFMARNKIPELKISMTRN